MLRRLTRARLLDVVFLLPLVGCVEGSRQVVESATVVTGRLWLTGADGLAISLSASGERVDASYPQTRDPSAYVHHPNVAPTATVIELGGATILITRAGERYAWRESTWVPLPDVIRRLAPATPVQVDSVLVHGDLLFLQLHDGRLIWLAPETGVIAHEERISRHVEPLAVLSGALVGVAFDGRRRLLVRRVAPDQWEKVALLPNEPDGLELMALGRAGDHYVVVTARGVTLVDANGSLSRVDLGLGRQSRILLARVDEERGLLMHVGGTRSGFFQMAMESLSQAGQVKATQLARCAALEYHPQVVAIIDRGGLVAVGADGSLHQIRDGRCSQIGEAPVAR